jgi:hypothetical protein
MAGLSGRVAADFGVAAAAFLGQVGQQRAHALDVDGVDNPALVARRGDEAGALELGQMRRQGRRCDREALGDLPGRQTDRALANEEAEDLQPGRV